MPWGVIVPVIFGLALLAVFLRLAWDVPDDPGGDLDDHEWADTIR